MPAVLGTVTVTLPGALLTAASAIHIGQSGQGVLDVLNDGNVQITNTSIGNLDLGGSGNGPEGGTGTVVVASGGSIEADANLFIWAGSTLSVDASSGVDVGTSGTYVAGAVNVESGHTLVGDGTIEAAVQDNGAIDVPNPGDIANSAGGFVDITGPVTGTGSIDLGYNMVLELGGSLAGSQTIDFGGVADELVLGAPGTVIANPIENLANGDVIELGGSITITGASVTSPGTVTIDTSSGATYVLSDVSFVPGATQQFYFGQDVVTGNDFVTVSYPYFFWTGATSTDYATAGNWQGGVVPDATDGAVFQQSSGGTVTGTGSALDLTISGTGAWLLSGATLTVAGLPSLPYTALALSDSGNLAIDGGTLNAAGISNIGSSTGATSAVEAARRSASRALASGRITHCW